MEKPVMAVEAETIPSGVVKQVFSESRVYPIAILRSDEATSDCI